MKVRDVMTTDLGVCTLDCTIEDAAQIMVHCNCGCVPVVEDRLSMQMLGLITDRDIACRAVARGLDCRSTPASQIMSTQVATVKPDDSMEDVERVMEELQVRRVPVVNEVGCLLGMVATADVALASPQQETGEVLREISRPYVS